MQCCDCRDRWPDEDMYTCEDCAGVFCPDCSINRHEDEGRQYCVCFNCDELRNEEDEDYEDRDDDDIFEIYVFDVDFDDEE